MVPSNEPLTMRRSLVTATESTWVPYLDSGIPSSTDDAVSTRRYCTHIASVALQRGSACVACSLLLLPHPDCRVARATHNATWRHKNSLWQQAEVADAVKVELFGCGCFHMSNLKRELLTDINQ